MIRIIMPVAALAMRTSLCEVEDKPAGLLCIYQYVFASCFCR